MMTDLEKVKENRNTLSEISMAAMQQCDAFSSKYMEFYKILLETQATPCSEFYFQAAGLLPKEQNQDNSKESLENTEEDKERD